MRTFTITAVPFQLPSAPRKGARMSEAQKAWDAWARRNLNPQAQVLGADARARIAELEADRKDLMKRLSTSEEKAAALGAELAALNKGIGALVMAAGGEVTITEYMLVKDIEVEWYREPADDSQVIRARWPARAEEGTP